MDTRARRDKEVIRTIIFYVQGSKASIIISPTFSREKTWTRILHGHTDGTFVLLRPSRTVNILMQCCRIGHCIFTLGTDTQLDTKSIFERCGWWLLKQHNYAVVGACSCRIVVDVRTTVVRCQRSRWGATAHCIGFKNRTRALRGWRLPLKTRIRARTQVK
jgi:hypothetical protein